MSSKTKRRVRTCLSVPCASKDCTGPNEETKRCCLAPGAVLPCRTKTFTIANGKLLTELKFGIFQDIQILKYWAIREFLRERFVSTSASTCKSNHLLMFSSSCSY